MGKTNIVWLSYHKPEILDRGYWDQGLLEDTFKQDDYEHHDDFDWSGNDQEGAIVVINGRTHTKDTDRLNADIVKLKWCLLIITGDEEAIFPWRDVRHPLMRVWVMLPRIGQHDDVSFKLPNGYRPTTMNVLKNFDISGDDRPVDWFFAGQVTHERRQECARVLKGMKGGLLVETQRFGEEKIGYEEYLAKLTQSKIAPCPSGPESPDSFRLYEALEAGCVPVVDAYSPRNPRPGFWQYLFGHDVPFPIVNSWDELPSLMPQLLRDYPHNANKISAWWMSYKRRLHEKLKEDIKSLHG